CVRPRSQFAGELEQPISRGVARQMARVLTHAESLCPKGFGGEKGICAVLRHVLQKALPTNELSRGSHIGQAERRGDGGRRRGELPACRLRCLLTPEIRGRRSEGALPAHVPPRSR